MAGLVIRIRLNGITPIRLPESLLKLVIIRSVLVRCMCILHVIYVDSIMWCFMMDIFTTIGIRTKRSMMNTMIKWTIICSGCEDKLIPIRISLT
ncbi:hypothetical protein D3C76_1465140 [compost metagenome]